jgi:Fic-DOC domain mobile mystery protein B
MQFDEIEGATLIDPNEADGLIPSNVQTQEELNEWEQENIVAGEIWLNRQKIKIEEFLTIDFIKKSHKKMFNETWRWAGNFRTSDKNIGGSWNQISTQLRSLCDDVLYQINHQTFSIDEIAIRFHHRLVSIHCFPNGNGRHARIMVDCLLRILGQDKFTWGGNTLTKANEMRKNYINALKQADHGIYQPLLHFARS